jgi:hypothetical protein
MAGNNRAGVLMDIIIAAGDESILVEDIPVM